MKTRFRKLSVVWVALILCLSIVPLSQTVADASSGFSASISPLPILLSAKPGTSVSSNLRVNNPSSHNEKLKVVIKTFSQEGPNGNVVLHDPTSADSFVNWISFDRPEFDAPPGLWQTVKMTINLPSTASYGYYFAVEFTSANAISETQNGASVQGAVASFVLLNAQVPGEKRQINVTSFNADHRFYEFLPANFMIRLHNSGNVFSSAAGNIFIMKGSKQIAVLNVNDTHGLILPASNRVFSTSWNAGFPAYRTKTGSNGQVLKDRSGNPERNLNWDFSQVSKLRFGHYTAKLALIYNDGNRDIPITGEVSFWVVPWRLIAGLLLILIFMIIGFWSSFRRLESFAKKNTSRISNLKRKDDAK